MYTIIHIDDGGGGSGGGGNNEYIAPLHKSDT